MREHANLRDIGLLKAPSHYLASLKIEEEADEDNFGMNLSNISQLSHSATQPPSRAVYEVQTEPDMERSFRIFCVLEDTHLMQHEVRKAWHLFATHKMALITATTITTVAIGLVGRAEAQLIADYPGAINPSHSYRDMVLALSTEDMEASTFGEFLYLPVGRTLMCIAQQHGNFGGHDYPVPLHRIKSPSHDGPRPVGAPHRLRTQDDDEFIYQLVQDFSLLEEFQRADSEFRSRDRASELRTEYLPTFDDIFQDAIRCVWKAGEVQMRSVFATRALLDILDICPNFKGVPLLHEEGRRQYELFEFFMDEEGALDNASGFRWHTKDWPLVKEIHDRVTAQMAGPGFVEHKKVMLEEYSKRRQGLVDRKCTDEPPPEEHTLTSPNLPAKRPRTDGAPILHEETVETCERSEKRTEEDVAPNPDPALYIKKNPLFCGTLMLCQTMSTEAAGVALANHHMSLFGVAHLYNAFQALKIIDIIWPDMERAISVHADAFFANEIPTTPQEMRTQMFFRLGIDRSMHPIPDRKNEEKKYIATSSASLLLLQFFRQTQPLETSIYQMQEDLRQRQLKVSQPHDASSPHAAITPLTSLSLRTFFIQLEQFATAALSDAQFPYLGLTKLCIHLLQSVREALEANKYPVPRRSNTDDSNDMSLILMVADLLNNNSVVWTKSGKKKEPCKGLKLAAKEFERMWADWQSDEFKQVRHKYFPDDVGER